jgi:hypothetical protein
MNNDYFVCSCGGTAPETFSCHRCGKTHLTDRRVLELNSWTGEWTDPLVSGAIVETSETSGVSQGIFSFGPTCAKKMLNGIGHRNEGRYPYDVD